MGTTRRDAQLAPRVIAGTLWIGNVLFGTLDLVLGAANGSTGIWSGVVAVLVTAILSTLAVAIAVLHPRNAIGWLLLIVAFTGPLGESLGEYALYGRNTRAVPLPHATTAAAIGVWASPLGLLLTLTLVIALFPTGRVVTPRWRLLVPLALLALVLYTLGVQFAPLSVGDSRFTSGYGLLGSPATDSLAHVLIYTAAALITAAAAGSLASLFVRFRRARGVERQQVKWLALVAVVIVSAACGDVIVGLAGLAGTLWDTLAWELFQWSFVAGAPIAIAVALLRHNLYDIDRLLNRALVYALLSIALAGAYLGLVVALSATLEDLARSSSTLVTALATLIVAALFQPVRAKIQSLVDRRFYRQRYDAARLMQQFASHAREGINVDALAAELLAVVQEAMQPRHVSLWLCPVTRSEPRPERIEALTKR